MILVPVLAFNTGAYIFQAVTALLHHHVRIVVIDNGSDVPIADYLPYHIQVVRLPKGVGIIHGRNLGFTLRMEGEGVMVLADDILVPPGNWEDVLDKYQDVTLAMRPEKDIAFTHYNAHDDPEKYPDYIPGAPTSFQCVHFPSQVLDKIGYVDERYIWGDDGYMMRKNKHGVLRNFKITTNQALNRGPKYRPMRDFYEELWRPGKIDGPHWDPYPVRYTIKDVDSMVNDICPTLWTMKREENPLYYDMSAKIKEDFELIWENPDIDRKVLLEELCHLFPKT